MKTNNYRKQSFIVATVLMILFGIIGIDANAQTITIPGANTNGASNRKPYGNFFGFERTHAIYTATETGGAAGNIATLSFFVNSVSSPAASTPVIIRMNNSSAATVASTTFATAITGATTVFTGNILSSSLIANSYVTVTLTTPFNYTGGTLEITVEANGGGSGTEGSTAKQFRWSAPVPAATRCQTWQADGSAPTGTGTTSATRPNIQYTLVPATPCAAPPTAGAASASPASISSIGQTFTLSLVGATTGASGLTYQWQSAPDNATWSPIAGATSASFVTTEATTTWYRCLVTCTNPGGGSDISSSVQVVLSSNNMNMFNGSVSLCSANFYDSQGPVTNYNNNENFTLTLNPSTPGAKIQVIFSSFSVETCCDHLRIYNGPSTASPLIGTFDVTAPGTILSTDATGALTFNFTSDGSVVSTGWVAAVSCQLPCSAPIFAGTATSTSSGAVCNANSATLSLAGTSPDPNVFSGMTFQWKSSSSPGGPYSNISGATNKTFSTGTITSSKYYVCVVTCSAGGSDQSNEVAVLVTPGPSAAPVSTPAGYCATGGGPVVLTAEAVDHSPTYSYLWSTGQTGYSINENVTVTTTFTVTVTDGGTGCSISKQVAVGVFTFPSSGIAATATPAGPVCSNTTTQLDIPGFSSESFAVTSIPYAAAVEPGSGVTTLVTNGTANVALSGGSLDDGGWGGIPIGFNYNFFGNTFSTLAIGTNGLLMFGTVPGYGTAAGQLGQFSFVLTPQVFPNASNPGNVIAYMAGDMIWNFVGDNNSIKYWTEGFAPVRRFVAQFTNARNYNIAGTPLTTVQVMLYETTGIVEIHVFSAAASTPAVTEANCRKTIGLQDATKTIGAVAPGRQAFTTAITVPEAWRFIPPSTYTYAWTSVPSGMFSGPANINNPIGVVGAPGTTTTYTVVVTNSVSQCSHSYSVSVDALPTPAPAAIGTISGPLSAVCGDNVSYTATGVNGNVQWKISTDNVVFIDIPGAVSTTLDASTNSVGTGTFYLKAVATVSICPPTTTAESNVLTVVVSPAACSVSPSSPAICAGTSTTLTANGNPPYIWSTGATTQSITVSPLSTTTYTVGCGVPGSGVYTYTASSIPFNTESCQSNTTTYSSLDDGISPTLPIGFTFNYFGINYTQFAIGTNGNIQLGDGSGTTNNPFYSSSLAGTTLPTPGTPDNIIAGIWTDLLLLSASEITYGVTGAPGSQKLIVCWNTHHYNVGAIAGVVQFQIVLNEGANTIQVNVISDDNSSSGDPQGHNEVMGVENWNGTSGSMPVGRELSPDWPVLSNESWGFVQVAPGGGCQCVASVTVNVTGPIVTASSTPSVNVCPGTPHTIAAAVTGVLNGSLNYSWSNANTNSSFSDSPLATTVYTVTVSDGVCSYSASVTAPVFAPPVTVASNNGPLCAPVAEGATALATLNATGGSALVPGSLNTPALGGNGFAGNVFDITANAVPVTIKGFKMGITAGTLAKVYYKAGGYGCSTSLSDNTGWTLVGQVPIVPAGVSPNLTDIPLVINITIPAGQTYGWVVVCDGSNYYTDGTAVCNTLASDANITIKQGLGGSLSDFAAGTFAFSNSPRNWNGMVTYETGSPNSFAWNPAISCGNPNCSQGTVNLLPNTTPYLYTVTITDGNGCTATSTTQVTVNRAPNIVSLQSATLNGGAATVFPPVGQFLEIPVFTESASCDKIVNYNIGITGTPDPAETIGGITHSMSGATVVPAGTSGTGSGTNFTRIIPTGLTTVTVNATNVCGNQNKVFRVRVTDNVAPVITPIPVPATNTNGGECNSLVQLTTPSVANGKLFDNCPNVSVIFAGRSDGKSEIEPYSAGTTTVTWLATDASANTSTATQNVVVNNIKPVITSFQSLAGNLIFVGDQTVFRVTFTDEDGGGTHTIKYYRDKNDATPASIKTIAPNCTQACSGTRSYTMDSDPVYYTTSEVAEPKVEVLDGCNLAADQEPGKSTVMYLAVAVAGQQFTTAGGHFIIPSGVFNPGTGSWEGYSVSIGNVVKKATNGNSFKGQLEMNVHIPNQVDWRVHTDNGTNQDITWDYLTISGCSLATFKGAVRVNGATGYKVLVQQSDKDRNPATSNFIRVKVTTNSGAVVFDTQPGLTEALTSGNGGAAAIIAALTNGSIKVQPANNCVARIEDEVTDGLIQNIPNPFTSQTEIRFTVPQDGKYTLTVYNYLGQEVATLFSEEAVSGTTYSVMFDGSNLGDGIYTYTLSGANLNETRRMNLVK